MPCNIEIKARATHFENQQQIAASLADVAPESLDQVDTFFNVPAGRLKLREFGPDRGELIYYLRADVAGPKRSDYWITQTREPADLKRILDAAFGATGVVRKHRTVYHVGQTRIHLDEVENLGAFVELEVVMQPGQPVEEGQQIAQSLMTKLRIEAADLIEGSYFDLLPKTRPN